MGLFSGLRRLFGGGSSDTADRGQYYYVRCDKCKEAIRFRVDPLWDLGPSEGGGGFTVDKHIIGQKCFRPIEVTLTFDDHRIETERSITGGTFITVAEYEQAQAPNPAEP